MSNLYHEVAREYVSHLINADKNAAFELILRQLDNGMTLQTVYLDILQAAMYEVGKLWQIGTIDVGVEHYCTAATQLLMGQLFARGLGGPRNGKKMVGCCIGSELHELGMRMVCDIFEFAGWDTYFAGAMTPEASLVELVVTQEPDVVCLSTTLAYGIGETRKAIVRLRRECRDATPKILAGGLAFAINPEGFTSIGADAITTNALDTLKIAESLTAA